MKRRILSLGFIVVLILALLTVGIAFREGYFERKTSLLHETIDTYGAYQYREVSPMYLVAADLSEIASIQKWVNPAAEKAIGSLNYEEYFVIAVFQGRKPTGGYKIEIIHVAQYQDQVEIKVRFTEPKPGQGVTMERTSPSHIVKVKKIGMPQRGRLLFIFLDDVGGQELACQEHIIP